ncbi:MAG: hypothetical protein JJ959_05870 [Nisaea sp.]|jgi:hypothetical protein|uniref:hypothetical protein n=1 Tax=Nisaea sp. TaxID=2024842 RepID=UPI001B1B712A|nr:hypothetical protein [Nisaea sp.]MBO6560042.1 hypothetical protein [Nisaea sp.]
MLLIERVFARFTIWLCDLFDLTQVDVDHYKEREFGIAPVPHHVESARAAERAQLVYRFRR